MLTNVIKDTQERTYIDYFNNDKITIKDFIDKKSSLFSHPIDLVDGVEGIGTPAFLIINQTCPLVTSNMMCFDLDNKLEKYNSSGDIINAFYEIKLDLYKKRRVSYDFVGFFFFL